ncbi:tRNA(m5U54)methyltransferase [Geopyxis carbonaria]|nr:tRNA(m5U54)methyltransferase [Geopyxis carbonaria]
MLMIRRAAFRLTQTQRQALSPTYRKPVAPSLYEPLRMDTTSTTPPLHDKRKRSDSEGIPPVKAEGKKKKLRFQKERKKKPKAGGHDEVLAFDIKNLLAAHGPTEPVLPNKAAERFRTVEVDIKELSSVGDGIGILDGRAYTVPFSLPGDRVKAKVVREMHTHTVTDFISVITPSPDRDDSLVGCKYFTTCGGCQFQMLPYAKQLEHKQRVVQKAYAHFSDLTTGPGGVLPEIGETIGSPLHYGYRTKLTPHFDSNGKKPWAAGDRPKIGFQMKGPPTVLDIEDCPIGTEIVRKGLKEQRQWVFDNITSFKNGATLLLRESTIRTPSTTTTSETDLAKYTEEKLCITDNKGESTEYIGDFKFVSPAGSFFQNNNSILPTFTEYIRTNLSSGVAPPKYLVDAYCGSGLFTVTCGGAVDRAIGVDISADSVEYARRNAEANGVKNATFIAGDAEQIFKDIDFPGSETSCIIDPPRKGCDHLFLNQLLEFRPRRIVYVSCNVHTQARDLGYILGHDRGKQYRVDSIRGFDFFPQTHHVESVAVLTWVD